MSLLLLSFVGACSNVAPAEDAQVPSTPPDRVDVVYFYDSKICQCQIAPGERIQSDLFINFGGDLGSGKLTYKAIDLATDNTTMAARYGTTEQSLFLNIVRGDQEQIVPLPELFLVKDNEEALDRLINNRIPLYLSGAQ